MERLERLAPLAAVVGGLLWIVGLFVVQSGNPADPDTAEGLVAYFRDERTTILAGGALVGVAVFLFFWFLAALPNLLDRRPGDDWLLRAATIGGTAGGALLLALTGPQTTGATTDTELVLPETSVALWRLSHTFFVASEVAFSVFVAAVSLRGLAGDLPRWLVWAGLVVALLLLLVPIAWLALIILMPLWLVALGVVLMRRRRGAVVQA